jgi:hypothetical protein
VSTPPKRGKPHLELVAVDGNPTADELKAAQEAIDAAIEAERQAQHSSLWLRSGRAYGRRLGMYDYRDRFSHEDAWRLSVRFPAGGREYPGLNGRGDAK